MATLRKSMTTTIVNAAFLQEIKDANTKLWAILDCLRHLERGSEEPKATACQLVDQLDELRDCIGMQFSLEETYGFIENSRTWKDTGVASAECAKTQHRELYLQLHEICEQVEEAQYRGTIVRDLPIYFGAFEQFDDALRAHEELESELIRNGLGIGRFDF